MKAGWVVRTNSARLAGKMRADWREVAGVDIIERCGQPDSSAAEPGRLGVSLAITICAQVRAVTVLLFTTNTFS